ncbi:MAG: glycosyltransferase family 4 protein [Planctomycetota bacterium]
MARVAWDVAKALAARGHQMALVAGDGNAHSRTAGVTEEVIDGVRVVRYPKPAMSAWDPWRAGKQIADCAAAIRNLHRQFSAEVMLCHSIFTVGAAAQACPDVPLLQTVHSPAIQEIIYNWQNQGVAGRVNRIFGTSTVRALELQCLRQSTALHALSRYTVSQMEHEYSSSVTDYRVIPHWADTDWFRTVSKTEARRELGWPQGDRIVFTVRQLRYRYGIDTAIQAIAPLAAKGECRFFIGGSGACRAALEAQIDRLSARDSVSMLGRLTDEHLRLAYQAADLFILPTRELECFGLIILEALACGLPVIGTTVGAIPENLSPILPQYLVSPDDPEAMRRKVAAFLADELPGPGAEALIHYTRTRFGKDLIVSQYEQFIGSLCAS